jgi:hypothetical protein
VADHRGNVIALPGWHGLYRHQQERVEALRNIVAHLDDLHRCLREFSPRPGWSAKRWMIASTPFRMRLTSAHRGLGELTTLGPFGEQDAIVLAFQLNDACRAAGQRMNDIEACLGTLQDTEAPPAERARRADQFVVSRSRLVAALSEIQRLIIQRFPSVLVER